MKAKRIPTGVGFDAHSQATGPVVLECLEFPVVFREVVSTTLREVFGMSGASALLSNLAPIDYGDVRRFHEKLKAVLGVGTSGLEAVMVRGLARRLDVPVSRLSPDDLERSGFLVRQILWEERGGLS
ncbi:MAG: hypothetical protein ACLP9K_08950 [Nitrososphaerales archaeon]